MALRKPGLSAIVREHLAVHGDAIIRGSSNALQAPALGRPREQSGAPRAVPVRVRHEVQDGPHGRRRRETKLVGELPEASLWVIVMLAENLGHLQTRGERGRGLGGERGSSWSGTRVLNIP